MRVVSIIVCVLSLVCSDVQAQEGNQAELVSLSGYTQEGHKKWDLLAESVEIFPEEDDIDLQSPKGVLYDNGDPEMYLKAQSGTYNPKTGNIFLKENVQMEEISGTKVKTSELYWDSEKAVLEMKNDVEITKNNAVITGRNMRVVKDKNIANLEENVKLKVFGSQATEHPSVITCTGKMEVNYQNNYVEFFDNVVISDPQINLKADYMKVFFDRPSRKLDRVICKGNVAVAQDTKKAMGGMAEYDGLEGVIYLSDHPKVLKDGNILTADNITFFLDSERVVCEPSAQLVLFFPEEDREFFGI